MRTYPFTQVDVFAPAAFVGNPLAVVHAADDVSDEDMARFANWTNLSETTFLLAPTVEGADYRVRIFTTTDELPFAGHPTLGSAYAWLAAGGQPKDPDVVVQECGAGLVRVRRDGPRLAFAATPLSRSGPVDDELLARLAAALRIEPSDILETSWLVNGPSWVGVRLASAADVLALQPDPVAASGLEIGIVGPHPAGSEAVFEVRALIALDGAVVEDPVTGSLNAGHAQWLIGSGQAPDSYVAAQGTVIGRAGRVHVDRIGDTIWIGGEVVPAIEGTVRLPAG